MGIGITELGIGKGKFILFRFTVDFFNADVPRTRGASETRP